MRKTRLYLILLPITVLMFAFFVGTAKAGGNLTFVISPKQEAVENVNLWGSGNASGTLSVNSGQIDFFIKDPDGGIVQEFLNTSTTPFTFAANKTGNYSFCMVNNYEALNLTVDLHYGVELAFYGSSTLGISTSTSMSTQIAPTILRPPPDKPDDDGGSDYVIEPYVNLQGAGKILGAIDSSSAFLPFRGVNLTGCIVASVTSFMLAAGIELCVCKRRLILRQIRYLRA